jgi:hypothetical protein
VPERRGIDVKNRRNLPLDILPAAGQNVSKMSVSENQFPLMPAAFMEGQRGNEEIPVAQQLD